MTHYGATPEEWQHLDRLGLGSDLLPVVSRPGATISPKSSMKQLGKTPSQYNGGQMVVGIKQWTDHQASPNEIRRWQLEPDYGICIQTRRVRAIDIDVEHPAVAKAIAEAVERELETRLPLRRRPDSGKCLLAFQLPGEFPKRVMKVEGGMIEFLGTGQQFIAAGTHPKGAKYEWRGGLPEQFPEITPEQFEHLWDSLELQFAIEEPKEFKLSDRRRGQHLDVDDPVATWLYDNGMVLSEDRRGGLLIECPWADEHTGGETGDSSTMWLIAGTNGHGQGHFRCLHSHCDHRTRQDYLEKVGYAEDYAADFEDLGPDPDALPLERPAAEVSALQFEVIPAAEFLTRPRPGWVIKNLIPRADLGVIYGESGAGKSFVMIDLAMAIARGTPWRGLKVKQGRVVYIVAEGGGGFRNRLEAYAQHHDISLGNLPFGVVHAAPNLLDAAQVKALCAAILKAGADVIVVDTFAQTTPGANENAAEDMGRAISNIRAVGRKAGAVVILVHHAGKDASRGARGWSGIKAAADFEIEVTRSGADRSVNTTKQKDGEDDASWPFKLQTVPIGIDDDGDVIESCVIVESDVQVEAGVRGGGRKAISRKRLGPWEQALLDTFQELALGGDVLKTELIIRTADKRPDVGSVRDRRKNVGKSLAKMSKGDDAAFISSKDDDYVTLVQ